MARGPKFRITHSPELQRAKRYRYALVHGKKVLASSEGYPTHQHVVRAVEGLWMGLCAAILQQLEPPAGGAARAEPAAPYAKDSLKAHQAPD